MPSDHIAVPPNLAPLSIERQQHTLLDYSRLLASCLPVKRLLPLTAVRLARGVGVVHTKVLRFDMEHGDLLLEAGTGWRPGSVGAVRFPIDAASPPGRTYLTRRTAFVDDLPGSGEYRYAPFMREHGIRSLVNAPVVSGGVVWGVLELDSTQPCVFNEFDARFLQVMANMLGVAIERASDQETARTAVLDATQAAKRASAAGENQALRLHEVQHRMKNNLSVIAAMVQLERRQYEDARTRARLGDLMNRIAAIALAHDQLSAVENETVVDLAAYLLRLADTLALQHGGITIEHDLAPVMVPLDQAVPLGLIVNELVTNAAKYAFPAGGTGMVWITLAADPKDPEAVLTVRDEGGGMGPPRSGSLGTSLVEALVGQIGGTVERPAVARGTSWVVHIPVIAAP